MDRAQITGRGVAEGVPGRDSEAAGRPGDDGRRKADEDKAGGRRRVDGDACLGAGNAAGRRVRRGQRLAASGFEGGAEVVLAGVRGGERVVRRQYGLRIGAGEVDRARVANRGVAEWILGDDRNIVGYSGGGGRREAGNDQATGGGGVDRDGRLRAGNAAGSCIRGG